MRSPKKKLKQSSREAPPSLPSHSPRRALLAAVGVFVLLFAVYCATLIPTMVDQDSGELAAAAHVLGIAHPTGYPLWVVLGRLCDLLPVGHTSAYRVALLSVVSAAAAGALITWLVILLGGAFTGVFAGLAFGLWFPTWSQAVRAEVYALSGLLFALFLLALFKWGRNHSTKNFLLLALAGGFVSMHHRTAFLAVAPVLIAAFVLMRPRRIVNWILGWLLFLAPFSIYLYLPIRAAAHPPVNWTNPITLDRFLWHAMGKQYTHFALNNYGRPEVLGEQASKLLGESLAAGAWQSVMLALLGAPLIVWGFVSLYRRQRMIAISLAAGAVLLCFWVLGWGETTDLKVFLGPLGAVLALFGGLGLASLDTHSFTRLRGRFLAVGAGLAITVILLSGNWARSDQSNIWKHRDRWVAALSQMDKNAIFISDFDVPSFATIYLQNVEGFRKDITLLRTVGMMQQWYVDLIAEEELRRTADALWTEIRTKLHLQESGTPEFNQGTALFAWRLAQHYRGRRTVYALHGPVAGENPGPPYFVELSEDLIRLQFNEPDLTQTSSINSLLHEFPAGVSLAKFSWDGAQAGNGEMLGFRVEWRLSTAPPPMQFGILLEPENINAKKLTQKLRDKGRFIQGFPLLYSLKEFNPTPEGKVYEQQGAIIIPSNAPPGAYRVKIGIAPPYSEQYQDLIEVPGLEVQKKPLPRNGP